MQTLICDSKAIIEQIRVDGLSARLMGANEKNLGLSSEKAVLKERCKALEDQLRASNGITHGDLLLSMQAEIEFRKQQRVEPAQVRPRPYLIKNAQAALRALNHN